MKVLVTGGAGFIGSNLVERLVKSGNKVEVLDNLHTGSMKNLSKTLPKGAFHRLDCKEIATGLARARPDVILHLGMYSSSPMYLEEKRLVGEVLEGATAVFDYARGCGARVVFASSSSLYNGHAPPHREEMIPKIMDFYTEARYGVERLAELYHDMYGLSYAGMRFFSVYGPHEEAKGKYANLVTQFVWAVQSGKQIVIRGDGSPRRDFVHVSDVVSALTVAAESNKVGIFNVGTGVSHSLNEAIDMISEHAGRKVDVVHLPEKGKSPLAPGMPELGKHYITITQASTRKSARVLGFRAQVDLKSGIGMQMGKKVDA